MLLPIVALGPGRLLALIPDAWEPAAAFVFGWLDRPLIGLVLVLALTTLYKIALPLKPPWYRAGVRQHNRRLPDLSNGS